ncbi:PREDICTED: uncharacterized protein LOC108360417 isoform X3 [Rhagoletis zephyria]|uniref:uncharacterized protein LOC108360417 isoform X3 n=1 Tax=Rhagoletis zephyria TaxID=28612 RepID=UPI00081163F8|nr:PREDICTED: uncharacterized protein LOC108360417 isoform X3 [Rhagoletis zephyria]
MDTFPMEGYNDIKDRPQRMRKGPIRKWSEQEQRKLIDFLRTNLPIEKPTARLYYQRFSQHSKIAIEWRLVRSKVRNLRVVYTKAKCWQSSDEAMLLSEERRREMVLKMCNFFDDFEEISNRHGMDMQCSLKSLEFPQYSKLSDPKNDLGTYGHIISCVGTSDTVQTQLEPVPDFAEPDVKIEQELSLHDSTIRYDYMLNETSDSSMGDTPHKQSFNEPSSINCESDELNSRHEMFDERDFKERKLALEIEKFNFEKEKFFKMQELRKWELQSQERIRKLELQMQERIAIRDLNIKERIAIMELERRKEN